MTQPGVLEPSVHGNSYCLDHHDSCREVNKSLLVYQSVIVDLVSTTSLFLCCLSLSSISKVYKVLYGICNGILL